MYVDINNFNTQPVVLILYQPGSSGEFFAHALTDSISDISKTLSTWENQTRVKYSDYFGRSLNSGDSVIDPDTVISRINLFFNQRTAIINKYHIGIMHPNAASVGFVTEYFAHCPVIEITRTSELSQKFGTNASRNKIEKTAIRKTAVHKTPVTYHADRHLKVEWEDLMLNNPSGVFAQVLEFLQVTGNTDKFISMVQDYLQRNQSIINQLNEH